MDSQNTFYTTLKPGQIRLLHVQPAEDIESCVVCDLRVVDLSDKPVYDSLSYCWGNMTNPQTLTCKGRQFNATQSLYTVLQRLRCNNRELVVWADATGINQGIYKNATPKLA